MNKLINKGFRRIKVSRLCMFQSETMTSGWPYQKFKL